MDRHVFDTFPLTIACHPSETEKRMMLRIVCFAMHADSNLTFGRGISTDSEPDLWQKSLSNDIELWIDLGTPDEGRVRKARGRAERVLLYVYGDRAVAAWWAKNETALKRFNNVTVMQISDRSMQAMATFASNNMSLQGMIEAGQLTLSSAEHETLVEVELTTLKT